MSRRMQIVIGVVCTLAVVVAVFFAVNLFSQQTAGFRGETSKRNQVEANGSYRIAAYDDFYNLCAGVQSAEASIRNLQTEAKDATPQRKAQIGASITALRNSRAEDINQYNANARKSYTAGQFRSSDLPFHLDLSAEETTCTA